MYWNRSSNFLSWIGFVKVYLVQRNLKKCLILDFSNDIIVLFTLIHSLLPRRVCAYSYFRFLLNLNCGKLFLFWHILKQLSYVCKLLWNSGCYFFVFSINYRFCFFAHEILKEATPLIKFVICLILCANTGHVRPNLVLLVHFLHY